MKTIVTALGFVAATTGIGWAQDEQPPRISLEIDLEAIDQRQADAQAAADAVEVCIETDANGNCTAYARRQTGRLPLN